MTEDQPTLKALGKSAKTNRDQYLFDGPDFNLLETFPVPVVFSSPHLSVLIEVPEFTSLCPITKQPDFAKIVIKYEPKEKCVESKSLKLYLMGYRNSGEFHESCVKRICNDLVLLLAPFRIEVRGEFTPRGGISFWPTAVWYGHTGGTGSGSSKPTS